jgi:uncharacterized SAM-binding protein YcdF (DUF218 family)
MSLLYRFAVEVTSPFVLLFVWAAVALAYIWWKGAEPRRRLLWVALPVLLLALASTGLTAYLALGTLEWHYPPQSERPETGQAIVVLSGGIMPPDEVRRHAELSPDTLYRCLHAVQLYRQGPPCPVLVSGGRVLPDQTGPTLAAAMRRFLIEQGIPDKDIWTEERSRSTYENAVECRRILKARGIEDVILVTQASHMLRVDRSFRRQGLTVTPAPCYHRATSFPKRLTDYRPSPQSARDVEEAYHEWLGLVWYWLHGR